MPNRYDRDQDDDYGFGRRDPRENTSRDEDEQRYGQPSYAQGGRFGENRQQPPRQNVQSDNTWRDARDRSDQEYRGPGNRESSWRDSNRDNNYNAGRENNFSGRDSYYSSGRDYSGRDYSNSAQDNRWGYDRNSDPNRFREQNQNRYGQNRQDYRGLYQEQAWTRDPSSGNVYGYEYTTRVEPRRFNAGDESQDRWRSNVNDQNRRFDIDRGWHTPGSSGQGTQSQSRSQNHYGKGPKGYVRSDERIREDVCDRLSDDDEIDARDITVTVKNAEVILEGSVADRRSKHRAEDVAEAVSGVKDVTNHLRARKGLFQELGDKITGDDDAEHHGHRGSGTRNAPAGGAPQKNAH
jgi:osmotically-inducible protein OsmY